MPLFIFRQSAPAIFQQQRTFLARKTAYVLGFSLLAIWTLSPHLAYAQAASQRKVVVAPTPGWVKPVALSEKSQTQAKDASDGYLFLLKDYQTNFPHQTTYFHLIRKIYSQTGVQNGSEIEYTYDPSYQKLIFHEIKIIRDGQVLNRLDEAKFKVFQRESSKESHLYDESLTALLILNDVREGDLIEYSFSCVGRNPLYKDQYFASFYLQNYDPLEKHFIRVITSTDKPLTITYSHTQTKPLISTEGNHLIYQWELHQTPGLSVDAEVPTWFSPYPSVTLSEFTSWNQVKNWGLALYQMPNHMPLLADKAVQIKSANSLPEKQLEAALRFVQDEIRYTGLESGISGYKPHSPEKVVQQRFGDCKDKSLLLCALLRELGIEAYPALVNTSDRQEIKHWAPTPTAFDHCIVQVQFKGKSHWFDPTISNQRGDYQTIYCPNYGAALVIRDDTKGLEEMPNSLNSKVKVTEWFTVTSIEGKVRLVIETRYIGYEADGQREYYANNSLKEIEKGYLNYYAKRYPKIKVSDPISSTDKTETNEFITHENYEIEDFFFVSDSSQPLGLECTTYPQVLRDKIFIPASSIRTMPIGLSFPTDYEQTTHIIVPEPWTIEDENDTIANAFTSFIRQVRYQNDTISIQYHYKIFTDHVDNEQIDSYTKSQKKVLNLLGYGLTYNQNTTKEASAFRLNWMLMLLVFFFSIIVGFLLFKLHSYDPPGAYQPLYGEELGGWLIVFAIGLCVSPIFLLVNIFSSGNFDLSQWENIAYSGSASYNLSLSVVAVIQELVYTANLLACGLLIILFFNKRSSFPRLVTLYLAINLAYQTLEIALMHSLDLPTESNMIASTFVKAAIGVAYFNQSQRVKRTFVQTLKPHDTMTEVYRVRF